MNAIVYFTFALCCASIGAATNGDSAKSQYVIGLTPFFDTSVKDDVYRRVVGMILEQIPQKSSLAIYDAYNLTNITSVEVPDLRAFQSGKTRANQFRDQIARIKNFLAAENARPAAA